MMIEITNMYGIIAMLILLMFIAPSSTVDLLQLKGIQAILEKLIKMFK